MKDLYKKQEGLSSYLTGFEVNIKTGKEFNPYDNLDIKSYKKLLRSFIQTSNSTKVIDYLDSLNIQDQVKKNYKNSIESLNEFLDLLDSDFFDSYDSLVIQIKKNVLPSINYLIELFE